VTRRGLVRACALALSLASPSHAADPAAPIAAEAERLAESSFQLMLQRQQKLLEVSSRLRIATAELCGNSLYPVLGMVIHAKESLPPPLTSVGSKRHDIGDEPRVVWVQPDGVAARAGVLAGDVIRGFAGQTVTHVDSIFRVRSPADAKQLELVVERAGARHTLMLENVRGCMREPLLVLDDSRNASFSFDSDQVVVLSALIRMVRSDDELASVVGHELGHGVYGDHDDGPVSESAADYFGAYAGARAGYDPAAGAAFEQTVASDDVVVLVSRAGMSHPNSAERELAIRATLDEIEGKRARGEPLVPRVVR
jgi:PDZ domain-containing protein/peptidase M48-like protein